MTEQLKCRGWRALYCPNWAVVRVTWSYQGADGSPTTALFCEKCAQLADRFLRPIARKRGLDRWMHDWTVGR